jgi:hypothetical protein
VTHGDYAEENSAEVHPQDSSPQGGDDEEENDRSS